MMDDDEGRMRRAEACTQLLRLKPRTDEEFIEKMGYSWDACLVFPRDRKIVAKYEKKLSMGGIELIAYETLDEIVVVVRARVGRVARMADLMDWPMLLDEKEAEKRMKEGDSLNGIKPVDIRHDPKVTRKRTPYQEIYGKYDTAPYLQGLYAVEEGARHPFTSSALRLKLLLSILKDKSHGCGLKVEKCIRKGELLAAFPLHEEEHTHLLLVEWSQIYYYYGERLDKALEKIRSYFGERVAIYFTFLAHFTHWTRASGAVGLIAAAFSLIEVSVLKRSRRRSRSLPVFAAFQLLWAVAMLEAWKQREKQIALRWGMLGIEAHLPERPDYIGIRRKSLINGQFETYFPQSQHDTLILQSIIIISFLVLGVICIAGVAQWIRIYLANILSPMVAALLSALISSALVELANRLYTRIAKVLNTRENHRTDEAFVNALAIKLVVFFLVNNNCTLLYMAFLQKKVEGCPRQDQEASKNTGTCYGQLELNLIILFLTRTASGFMTDVVKPLFRSRYKITQRKRTRLKRQTEPLPPLIANCVDQFFWDDADAIHDSIDDYTQLAVRFSFAILFVVAFPALPALVFIANLLESHSDLRKFCTIKKREWPGDTSGIGNWHCIFETVIFIGVVTNTMVIFYTVHWTPLNRNLSTQERAFTAFTAQYFIFSLCFLLKLAIPDTPYDVTVQLERQAFIASKLITKIPDEDSDSDEDDDTAAKYLLPEQGYTHLPADYHRQLQITPEVSADKQHTTKNSVDENDILDDILHSPQAPTYKKSNRVSAPWIVDGAYLEPPSPPDVEVI